MTVGHDRYGEPYTTVDAFGRLGEPGKVLAGAVSRTSQPRLWIPDNNGLNYDFEPQQRRPGANDLAVDPFIEAKIKAAIEGGHAGYWNKEGRWTDISYSDIKSRGYTFPGFILIRRAEGIGVEGSGAKNHDLYITEHDGVSFRNEGRQYFWIPKDARSHDPYSGEYIGRDGVRYFNDGSRWQPTYKTGKSQFRAFVKSAGKGVVIVGTSAAILTAAAGAATASAAAGAGSGAATGAANTTFGAKLLSKAKQAASGAIIGKIAQSDQRGSVDQVTVEPVRGSRQGNDGAAVSSLSNKEWIVALTVVAVAGAAYKWI